MTEERLQTLLVSPEIPAVLQKEPIQQPTELKLDLWDLRQGETLLSESPKLQQMALSKEEVSDLHGMAFLPELQFHETPTDPLRHGFMKQMLQNLDFQGLKQGTALNVVASQIATLAFCEAFQALKGKVETSPIKLPESKTKDIECMISVARAAEKAELEINDFNQACDAYGLGSGKPGRSLDSKELANLFRCFQANAVIRQIARLAGCYKQVAQGCHNILGNNGMDHFTGVVLGCELSRILPMELLRIALPELELDFLRRFAEGQLQLRDFESNDPAGLGPVVVVVDESGSMNGAKIEHAKAIALTFAWLSRCQKRWCGLVSFSGGTGHSLLAIPPDSSKTRELLDWSVAFIGGGSDQDLPVSEMPAIFAQIGAPSGKTDLIYISDAQLRINTNHAEAFLEWKASVKAKLTSLVIGSEPGDLATISDKVHLFEMLSPALIGSEQFFSI